MKLLSIVVVLGLLLSSGTSMAQSAKNSVQVSELTLLPEITTSSANSQVESPWKPLLNTTLRTSQQKDLIMTVSLEAGLYSNTYVRSKNGTQDSATAEGRIEVRILVDGKPAPPGNIVFAQRYQHLMARFGGILQECTDYNSDGVITSDECLFTDEELQLVLRTLNANAFVFALDDVGAGTHNVQVQARVILSSNATAGSAGAGAWIGKGTVSVEEVRLTKGSDISL